MARKRREMIQIDFDSALGILTFTKEAEDIPGYVMVQMTETTTPALASAAAMAADVEPQRAANARSTRRS